MYSSACLWFTGVHPEVAEHEPFVKQVRSYVGPNATTSAV